MFQLTKRHKYAPSSANAQNVITLPNLNENEIFNKEETSSSVSSEGPTKPKHQKRKAKLVKAPIIGN